MGAPSEGDDSMIDTCLIEFIVALQRTLSSNGRLSLVKDFCLDHYAEFKDDDRIRLIKVFTDELETKKLQGQESYKLRLNKKVEHKNKNSTFAKPMFVDNYSAKQKCHTCKKVISSKNAFRWMQNGAYVDYHSLPSCFPNEHKDLFITDKKYCKWSTCLGPRKSIWSNKLSNEPSKTNLTRSFY